jgi:hypothetical protein
MFDQLIPHHHYHLLHIEFDVQENFFDEMNLLLIRLLNAVYVVVLKVIVYVVKFHR